MSTLPRTRLPVGRHRTSAAAVRHRVALAALAGLVALPLLPGCMSSPPEDDMPRLRLASRAYDPLMPPPAIRPAHPAYAAPQYRPPIVASAAAPDRTSSRLTDPTGPLRTTTPAAPPRTTAPARVAAPEPAQVAVDLSSPRAALATYYRGLAAGDATAAKSAVVGDEMAMHYIDAAAAFAAGLRDLDAAVTAKFGRQAVLNNPTFARSVHRFRGVDPARAINAGEVRVSGDIAIFTPRLKRADTAEGASPIEPVPSVLRNEDGKWKVAVGALRRNLYGKQAREADAAIEANAAAGRTMHELAMNVMSGRFATVDDVWDAGQQTQLAAVGHAKPTEVATAHPSPSPAHVPEPVDVAPAAHPAVTPAPQPQPAPDAHHPAPAPPQSEPAHPAAPLVVAQGTTLPAQAEPRTTSIARSPSPDTARPPPSVATTTTPSAVAVTPTTGEAVAVRVRPDVPAAVNPQPAPPAPPVEPVAVVSQPPPPEPAAQLTEKNPDAVAIEDLNRVRLDAIKTELAKGGDVNARDPLGRTALHRAAIGGETDIAKFLLDKGADVHAKDSQGWTPLHWAASSGQPEVAKLLLERGAGVNDKGELGDTPLYWAVVFDRRDMAELLVAHGADVNARDPHARTALHTAAEHDARAVAAMLIEKGADANARDENGMSPLHVAILHVRHALSDLQTGGASSQLRSDDAAAADVPLTPADVIDRGKAMIELLLAHGADVNAATPRGATPLHMAAWNGMQPIAQLLIARGADLTAKDQRGKTPLEQANERAQKEVATILSGGGKE